MLKESTASDSLCKGLIILMSGLPGTGKSTIARRVALQLGRAVSIFSTDRIRKELYATPTYTDEENSHVHTETQNRIRHALTKNRIVIYDATNLQERHRLWAFEVGDETNSHALVVFVTADESVVKQRLADRAANGRTWSDADWRVYLLLKETAEPVVCPHILIEIDEEGAADIRPLLEAIAPLI